MVKLRFQCALRQLKQWRRGACRSNNNTTSAILSVQWVQRLTHKRQRTKPPLLNNSNQESINALKMSQLVFPIATLSTLLQLFLDGRSFKMLQPWTETDHKLKKKTQRKLHSLLTKSTRRPTKKMTCESRLAQLLVEAVLQERTARMVRGCAQHDFLHVMITFFKRESTSILRVTF